MKKGIINILSLIIITSFTSNCQTAVKNNNMTNSNYELATFGGGCFWCTEAMFDQLNGVETAISGYSGGTKENPTYEEVCTGTTGHAEVIQVKYNPETISYLELLEVFFKTHDPTTLNRQGADKGTQYRSVVFYHNQKQKEQTEQIIKDLSEEKIWNDPIVTEVTQYTKFYSAEAYHQEYFANNPQNQYCQIVVNPKVEKFEKLFKDKIKK